MSRMQKKQICKLLLTFLFLLSLTFEFENKNRLCYDLFLINVVIYIYAQLSKV